MIINLISNNCEKFVSKVLNVGGLGNASFWIPNMNNEGLSGDLNKAKWILTLIPGTEWDILALGQADGEGANSLILWVLKFCLPSISEMIVTILQIVGAIGSKKIICTELYRQDFMPSEVYHADQKFGQKLATEHPLVMAGYHYLAMPIVKQMKKYLAFTKVVNIIAKS